MLTRGWTPESRGDGPAYPLRLSVAAEPKPIEGVNR